MASTSDGGGDSKLVSNQLASLVPSFDPSKDDVQDYSKKVQLLMKMWPDNRWTELATRLILNTSGSAFQKLQLMGDDITKNERKSIQTIIEVLGGQWGQIPLEKKYEAAEKALFKCAQRQDESNDSYLARADVLWQELLNKKMQLDELKAYIILRGSNLSMEDKKRVLVETSATESGALTMAKVNSSVRMLGAGFFHEVAGSKRNTRLKTYDQANVAEDADPDEPSFLADVTEETAFVLDDETIDALVLEGDEDAALVQDFEGMANDVLQSDEDLAHSFTAYTEARRRIAEKVRSRGFWPPSSSSKGKNKGRGKGKPGKGFGNSRKSLQQRILESRCRLCNKIGHWKAECPSRNDAKPVAPTTFVTPTVDDDLQGLPLEFLSIPEHDAMLDEAWEQASMNSFDQDHPSFVLGHHQCPYTHHHHHIDRQPNTHQHIHNTDPRHRLRQSLQRWSHQSACHRPALRTENADTDATAPSKASGPEPEMACFATHGSFGVVDLGASKTVIGSDHVAELIQNLHPNIQSQLYRCNCSITFRFGNHGTLVSKKALVIPIHGYHLKVAIVPGSTPFLLSNTLLRALGAVIDTQKQIITAKKINKVFPLTLTAKGLFLLDLNDLASDGSQETPVPSAAETHFSDNAGLPKGDSDSPRIIDTPIPKSTTWHHSQSTCTQSNPCHATYVSHKHTYSSDPEPTNQQLPKVRQVKFRSEMTDPTDLCSENSRFAQSFQVPHHDGSSHSQPAVAEPPGRSQEPGDLRESVPQEHERTGTDASPIRHQAPEQVVRPGVGRRSSLDLILPQEVRDLPQDGTSGAGVLHPKEGGARRDGWPRRTHRASARGRDREREDALQCSQSQGQSQGQGQDSRPGRSGGGDLERSRDCERALQPSSRTGSFSPGESKMF